MEKNRKRKASEEAYPSSLFLLDELSQDLLERVLSWLPTSSFLRLRSVCKRWSSVAPSATFHMSCSHVPFRDPWFLMVDQELDHSVIFDTSEGNWKKLIHSPSFNHANQIAVSSSGGLVCFRDTSGGLTVCNPVTGATRKLPHAALAHPLHAIAMSSILKGPSSPSYRIVLVSVEFSNISFRVFNSDESQWEDEVMLARKAGNSLENDTDGVYFLSKSGELVATNMQRSPSKEFSSVQTIEDGEEIVYFLGHSGTIMACNLTRRNFQEYPRLLPIYTEYSIDVVVCRGQMMVVVLWEFLETASLRVWSFSKVGRVWRQVAAMPPAMSHGFYGKKADINCVGCGDLIFVCLNCNEFSCNVMYHMVKNDWIELPKCIMKGKAQEFVSAFSFEPRIEASV